MKNLKKIITLGQKPTTELEALVVGLSPDVLQLAGAFLFQNKCISVAIDHLSKTWDRPKIKDKVTRFFKNPATWSKYQTMKNTSGIEKATQEALDELYPQWTASVIHSNLSTLPSELSVVLKLAPEHRLISHLVTQFFTQESQTEFKNKLSRNYHTEFQVKIRQALNNTELV